MSTARKIAACCAVLMLLTSGCATAPEEPAVPESLEKLAGQSLARIEGDLGRGWPRRARGGSPRRVGHPSHLRQEHQRPVLRPGLRDGSGPALADGDVASLARRAPQRDLRARGVRVRRAHPADDVPRTVGRIRVDELPSRGREDLHRLRQRGERLHRAERRPLARRVQAHRDPAGALDRTHGRPPLGADRARERSRSRDQRAAAGHERRTRRGARSEPAEPRQTRWSRSRCRRASMSR